MIWIDYAILAVIAVSAMVGFFRGFFREAIGLATWIVAFWLAFRFATPAAGMLEGWISVGSARLAVAFGVLFIAVLIIGAVFNHLMAGLVDRTGFAGTDRGLGGLFGVLRGAALLVLLVLIAGLTPVPRDDWWDQSLFVGHLERGAVWLRDWLPEELASEIRFDPTVPTDDSVPTNDTGDNA
ncbi:MAG: CvpA family protein [Salinisphaeraceae bacterium]